MEQEEIKIPIVLYEDLRDLSQKINTPINSLIVMAIDLLMSHEDEIMAMWRIKKCNPRLTWEDMMELLCMDEEDVIH